MNLVLLKFNDDFFVSSHFFVLHFSKVGVANSFFKFSPIQKKYISVSFANTMISEKAVCSVGNRYILKCEASIRDKHKSIG